MPIKSKTGLLFELPDDEEDARIKAAIENDPDTYELADIEWTQLKRIPVSQQAPLKIPIRIPLSVDVVEAFKAGGQDWQLRIDEALKEWLQEHRA